MKEYRLRRTEVSFVEVNATSAREALKTAERQPAFWYTSVRDVVVVSATDVSDPTLQERAAHAIEAQCNANDHPQPLTQPKKENTMKAHEYADYLHDIADGKDMSGVLCRCKNWPSTDADEPATDHITHWVRSPDLWQLFRRKKFHFVNNVAVPAPLQAPLPATFWVLSPLSKEGYVQADFNNSSENQPLWLERGLCFATESDARENFEAHMKRTES